MSPSRILKGVTGIFTGSIGLLILSGSITSSFLWSALITMLMLHVITYNLTKKDGGASTGSVLGIISSCIGWIPFVGMVIHVLAAVFLMIDAATPDKQKVMKLVH